MDRFDWSPAPCNNHPPLVGLLVQGFQAFSDEVRDWARRLTTHGLADEDRAAVASILDGRPREVLRRSVAASELKRSGAFFTGARLASLVADRVRLGPHSRILDPTCGAGDLLLACSNRLPVRETLVATIESWGNALHGRDLFPTFVETARNRLLMAAVFRGAASSEWAIGGGAAETFPGVRRCSILEDAGAFDGVTCLVMNPPYGRIEAPAECTWGAGLVNAAAVFVEQAVTLAAEGTQLVAILPDVLRSGARYAKWRNRICERLRVSSVHLAGQFDRVADVDVFLLDGVVTGASSAWPVAQNLAEERTIGDAFSVTVGDVVPHRHREVGPLLPFVTARDLPMWCRVESFLKHRRFSGRTHYPPFLAVRRTSRPGDRFRAPATLVCGDLPIAVENHLIVLSPRDRQVSTCEAALEALRSGATNDWLDSRIRCRHLTVSSVRDLPFRA